MCRKELSGYHNNRYIDPPESFIQSILTWALDEVLNDRAFWEQLKDTKPDYVSS